MCMIDLEIEKLKCVLTAGLVQGVPHAGSYQCTPLLDIVKCSQKPQIQGGGSKACNASKSACIQDICQL